MKSYRIASSLVIVLIAGFGLVRTSANGHEIFQDILKEKYTLKSFSCKTCHPDGDDRKLRTPFADLYAEEMKDGNWSEKWAQVEPKGEEAIAAFEKEIGEAFKKSLDNVGKATLTVDDLFAAGLLAGVRVDEKKRKAKEAEGKKGDGTATKAAKPDGVRSTTIGPSALKASAAALSAPSPKLPNPDSPNATHALALVSKSDD